MGGGGGPVTAMAKGTVVSKREEAAGENASRGIQGHQAPSTETYVTPRLLQSVSDSVVFAFAST